MATAPKVQTLDQIMAELQPGYAGQKDVINKQIANTDETYKASELALDAAKTQGFNQINDQATGKGTAFGGMPITEQADYLSTKYLPGKQAARAKQQEDKLTLQGQSASLDTDIRNKAFGSRENQVGAKNQWNLQQAAQKAAAKAAELQRSFTASQAEKDRAHQSALAAASRAAQAASSQQGLTTGQVGSWVQSYVKGKQGSDKYVSPKTYSQGYTSFYADTGGSPDVYRALMGSYVNPKHAQDYKMY